MEFFQTGDGSLTLLDAETGQHYHNRAGAYTEALENYLTPSGALKRLRRTGKLHLIDACFGLGYNSFVLLAEALNQGISGTVTVDAIDNNPELVKALPTVLSFEKFAKLSQIFELNKVISCGSLNFELRLHHKSLTEQLNNMDVADADLVYHDPFSPLRVPELWTIDIFQIYHRMLKHREGGFLTYSAASAVRGGLVGAGFEVFRTPAIGVKETGTIAVIPQANKNENFELIELTPEETTRLQASSSVPYRDPHFNLDRLSIQNNRLQEQEEFRKAKAAAAPPYKKLT